MLTSVLCTFFLGLSACQAPTSPDCYIDPTSGLEVCLQPVEPRTPEVTE